MKKCKSELLDAYEPPQGWYVSGAFPLDAERYVVYRTHFRGGAVVELRGADAQTRDITELVADRQVRSHRLFAFAGGFGLCDHNNAQVLLWPDPDGPPAVLKIEQGPASTPEIGGSPLAQAAWDPARGELLVGLRQDGGPTQRARYFATLPLTDKDAARATQAAATLRFGEVRVLDPKWYPKTALSHSPALEWLVIADLARLDGVTHVHCQGGSRSLQRSGPAFELSILSAIPAEDAPPRNLEVEPVPGVFSDGGRYFVQRPTRRKCLVVFDLQQMTRAFELTLSPQHSLAGIPAAHGTSAALLEDRLIVSSPQRANFCRVLR